MPSLVPLSGSWVLRLAQSGYYLHTTSRKMFCLHGKNKLMPWLCLSALHAPWCLTGSEEELRWSRSQVMAFQRRKQSEKNSAKMRGILDLKTPVHVLVHCPHDIVSFCCLRDGWKWAGKPKGLEFACFSTTSTCSFALIQSLSLESLGAPPKHYSPPPPSKQEIIGGDRGAQTLLRLVFCFLQYCCKLWRWTALSSFHPSWYDDKA